MTYFCEEGIALRVGGQGGGMVGSFAGKARGEGAEITEREVAEGRAQKLLNGRPMWYTFSTISQL